MSRLFQSLQGYVPSLLRPISQKPASRVSTSVSQVRGKKKSSRGNKDPRIQLIHYSLYHPLTPRPLKFSYLRHLRHWTIHRAWQLYKANMRRERELELERMYNSIRDTCEKLKTIGDGGRLYRIAISKQGLGQWAGVGTRIPTEAPGRNGGWDYTYKA